MDCVGLLAASLKKLPVKKDEFYYSSLIKMLETHMPQVWRAYDQFISHALKKDEKKITCSKGCSACCSHYVDSVEPMELLAIHLRIRNWEGYPALLEAFHKRATRFQSLHAEEGGGEDAEDRALFRYFRRGTPCPFLKTGGECGIYEFRPMSCRMFFAESPPRYCAGSGIATPWNKNFQVELPDAAEWALSQCSALLKEMELPEGLFAGLLEVNALVGKWDGAG